MNKILGLLLAAVIVLPMAAQAEDGIAKTYLRWGQIINVATSIVDKLSGEGFDMTVANEFIDELSASRDQLNPEMTRTELYEVIENFRDTLFELRGELWSFGREYANLRGN